MCMYYNPTHTINSYNITILQCVLGVMTLFIILTNGFMTWELNIDIQNQNKMIILLLYIGA